MAIFTRTLIQTLPDSLAPHACIGPFAGAVSDRVQIIRSGHLYLLRVNYVLAVLQEWRWHGRKGN